MMPKRSARQRPVAASIWSVMDALRPNAGQCDRRRDGIYFVRWGEPAAHRTRSHGWSQKRRATVPRSAGTPGFGCTEPSSSHTTVHTARTVRQAAVASRVALMSAQVTGCTLGRRAVARRQCTARQYATVKFARTRSNAYTGRARRLRCAPVQLPPAVKTTLDVVSDATCPSKLVEPIALCPAACRCDRATHRHCLGVALRVMAFAPSAKALAAAGGR